jgi:hypothetical protein
MKNYKHSFLAVLGLIVVASATLAYVGPGNSVFAQFFSSNHPPRNPVPVHTDRVAVR